MGINREYISAIKKCALKVALDLEKPVQAQPFDPPVPKQFYSNCLFEAIKAKLRNWKNVKIHTLLPRYNEVYCPHFMWTDGVHDYDFGVCGEIPWYRRGWFKGEIREHRVGYAQRLICHRRAQNGKGFAPLAEVDIE